MRPDAGFDDQVGESTFSGAPATMKRDAVVALLAFTIAPEIHGESPNVLAALLNMASDRFPLDTQASGKTYIYLRLLASEARLRKPVLYPLSYEGGLETKPGRKLGGKPPAAELWPSNSLSSGTLEHQMVTSPCHNGLSN